MQDTKFTVAIHILVMLAASDKNLNSTDLANSVGTNASYIRKVMAILNEHKIIASQRGKSGTQLLVSPAKLNLLDLYQAIEGTDPHIFQFHQNPNPACPVGRNIKQALFPFLEDAEYQLQQALKKDTLADVINRLTNLERSRHNESRPTD
ncbi:Rrf2 family transcriptional regulator [Limosilactobacillus caccae]|uniref:Rrf2 family transcriptional regulator n=1 Tax=Limosilactobacillus caccae TaxID=1926284 RepID=UPI000970A8CD|nr:Rrf2 family transcriptional regulator [Limosilactobacillus caccae]